MLRVCCVVYKHLTRRTVILVNVTLGHLPCKFMPTGDAHRRWAISGPTLGQRRTTVAWELHSQALPPKYLPTLHLSRYCLLALHSSTHQPYLSASTWQISMYHWGVELLIILMCKSTKAVSAYLYSKQILPFGCARKYDFFDFYFVGIPDSDAAGNF